MNIKSKAKLFGAHEIVIMILGLALVLTVLSICRGEFHQAVDMRMHIETEGQE